MTTLRSQSRRSINLLGDTGAASASVIATRLAALSQPDALSSPRQQREVSRMVSEKLQAGYQGAWSAGLQLAFLPARSMAVFASPASFTPAGYADACGKLAALWLGVGNAALTPARHKAVGNRKRLLGTGRKRR